MNNSEPSENQKISTIEDLAAMIERTVVADISAIKADVATLKTEVIEIRQDVKAIKDQVLPGQTKRIEKLDQEMKEVKEALAM